MVELQYNQHLIYQPRGPPGKQHHQSWLGMLKVNRLTDYLVFKAR